MIDTHMLGLVAGALAVLILILLLGFRVYLHRATRNLEQKVAEQNALREAAEAANKRKGEFLAQMTHEIRSPMNAIMGFTDLVLKTDLKPELRDYLGTVRTSAEWLMHIVNDVLEFSRMEGGALRLETSEFNFAECIRSAIKIVQPEAAARNLAVRHHIDAQIPTMVCGDQTRLRQVVFNLLDNAVKFTTTGSVMLAAQLEAKSADSVLVRVSVADTGAGISANKQRTIFEPFGQLEPSEISKAAGPGLGLAICRKLVTLMGGTIEIKSQLGAGSTFEFTAWFKKTPASSEKDKAPRVQHPKRQLSILIAEDNAVTRRLIAKMLESAGHHVTPASNGKELVHLFETGSFDLMLVDIQMPQMDGLEATRVIRASEPEGSHVPIYALTASIMSEDREKCFEAGMDGYIPKPTEVDTLLRLVSEVAASTPSAAELVSA